MIRNKSELIFFILYIIFSCHLFAVRCTKPQLYVLRPDLPVGWLIVDLVYYGYVEQDEVIFLKSANKYFRLQERQLVLAHPLTDLKDTEFDLHLTVDRGRYQRPFRIPIQINGRNIYRFKLDVYEATLNNTANLGIAIAFTHSIALRNNTSSFIRYAIVSQNHQIEFNLINRRQVSGETYAELYLSGAISENLVSPQQFYIGAYDIKEDKLLATARCDIHIQYPRLQPPKFTAEHYSVTVNRLPPHSNVLRVVARSTKGSVLYRIEPEKALFDISPFSGVIFSRYGIPNGRYSFNVIAKNTDGQESRTGVKIAVVGENGNLKQQVSEMIPNKFSTTTVDVQKLRYRRGLATDVVLVIPESHLLGMLKKRIVLASGERVIGTLGGQKHFHVHSNGTIELVKPLNYEDLPNMRFTAQIAPKGSYNPQRFQNIRVTVVDVDEPPVFQNGPIPYLSVVPYTVRIGYQVYQFKARDEGGQGDTNIEYRLINTEPPGTFTVDSRTGAVKTAKHRYKPGETYRVYVQARDKTPTNRHKPQDSEIAMLEIYAGDRSPQFLKQQYIVEIPENTKVGKKVVDVRANSFESIDPRRRKGQLSYYMYMNGEKNMHETSQYFSINHETGDVYLKKKLDYDDPTQMRIHRLVVVAEEDNQQSVAFLEIRIRDVNDNAPVFTQHLYTATVKEDVPIGKTIITVHADDKDSEENSRVFYSVDDHNFVVNERGQISAKNRLDADQKREKFFFYRFNVTAKDNGNPPLKSVATVQIRTENTNDEAPVFIPTNSYTAFVAEDAQGGTPVVRVQALDPDRDQVFYRFLLKDGRKDTTTELFEIDEDTGLIKLKQSASSEDLKRSPAPHNLTILATDDGSCCQQPSKPHEAQAAVSIHISDVNNNKPEFRDCKLYSQNATIVEGDYKSDRPVIIRVTATDEDSSLNGEIVYSLYYPQSESRKPFTIDAVTGDLRPSPYVRFDREQRPIEEVTVKATDKGKRPLIGFCQFTVQVKDVNDNAPQFDRASYETSISRTAPVGHSVVTVFADDSDAPQNARITYSLAPDPSADLEHKRDTEYFLVPNERSGEITLKKPIPAMIDRFMINVVATDNGNPPQNSTVQVTVKVHEKQQNAPQWESSKECRKIITVDEDIQINSVLLRCHAIPGDGSHHSISYRMTNAVNRGISIDKYFRVFAEKENGQDWFSLRTTQALDYEKQNNYTITLTALDVECKVTSDKQFHIFLRDKNDNVPRFTVDLFTGTVEEEQTVEDYMARHNSQPITIITAVDADSPGPQSEIRYRILGNAEIQRLFRIEETTGKIYPIATYDRERNDSFIFDVEARDNTQSSLPGIDGPNHDIVKVQIFVADINDNPPYFDKKRYEGRVFENEEINQDIITLKAHDLDSLSNLKYDLYGLKGERIPFGVRTDSGVIFVKEPLDYEKENEYHMKAFVTDGKHNTTTDVFIYVEDVNDNAPEFEKSLYETTILEEDKNVPKTLFMVRATDKDRDETSKKIVYRLEGQGIDEYFRINKTSGKIEAILPLDRDPPGIPVWRFIVQAIDDGGRGLIGYADVQVNLKDINDNSPKFPSDMYGEIEENREPGANGVYVMTVTATDNDDPATNNAKVEYAIVSNKVIGNQPVFRIDSETGKIYAMVKLDREKPSEKQFTIEVQATDRGSPRRQGKGNVTIRVLDVNDNYPYFQKQLYEANVAETASVGTAVMSIVALDDDNEAKDNVFEYSLVEEQEYFYMTTESETGGSNVGVLRVNKQISPDE